MYQNNFLLGLLYHNPNNSKSFKKEEFLIGYYNKSLVWITFAVLCFIAFLFSPAHDFELWSQVTYLRGRSLNASYLGDAHLLRYILVLPIFLMSDIYNIDANSIFRFVCFLNIFLITCNCITITRFYNNKNGALFVFAFGLFFLFLSIFMNGRMLFSFVGYSYLLSLFHRWNYGEINNLGLYTRFLPALMLCSVSTGTFLLCIVSIIVFSFGQSQRSKKIYFLYLVFFVSVLSPLIMLYLFKNINFYGGGFNGFLNMLNHGVGTIFHTFDVLVTMLLVGNLLLLIILMGIIYFKTKTYKFLILFATTGVLCGLFGYSTLSMSIIPIYIVFLLSLVEVFQNHCGRQFRRNLWFFFFCGCGLKSCLISLI